MTADLFEPFQLGDLTLANRAVMAPMTRNRAARDGSVPQMMLTHYKQRAGAGLIISESVPVSANAVGYPFTPGLYTEGQVASWRRLTEALHDAGTKIFAQLQYVGRVSHPSMLPGNATPVAPSAIKPEGQAVTYDGMQDFVTPRALETGEIPMIVAEFARAAEHARDAGFDGVEIHGANGYIIDQFLRDGSNRRDDQYGGNPENRMRLLNEILDAVSRVWPSGRVGLRLSPENSFNGMSDSDPETHFEYFIEQLNGRELAYLHILEGDMLGSTSEVEYRILRDTFAGPYIANNGYDLDRANAAIAGGSADLIAFGIPFLANPDLVYRLRYGIPLNDADRDTFYGGDETGYTDYPFHKEAAA